MNLQGRTRVRQERASRAEDKRGAGEHESIAEDERGAGKYASSADERDTIAGKQERVQERHAAAQPPAEKDKRCY